MSGYGRGGRGAALLQALEDQTRKPGQDAAIPAGAAQQAPVPTGRGALMKHLLAQREAEAAAAASLQNKPPMSLGRGLMSPAVSPPKPQTSASAPAPGRPMGMGRGLGLLAQTRSASGDGVPKRVPPPAPTVVAESEPVKAQQSEELEKPHSSIQRMLDRMSIEDKAVPKERGTAGRQVSIRTNYLPIQTRSKDGIFQYKVEFRPPLDSLLIRKRLVRELEGLPKPFEFDGATMFMPTRHDKIEGTACSREGQQYTILVELVRVVPYSSMAQFFNVMFNRIMSILKMCPIARTYYDPHKPTPLPQYKMEVWPGYVTSVREYDGGLMCLIDTSHKVLRTETVLDVMHDGIQKNRQNFKEQILKDVIGSVVLTRYNNRTWRIDDIDWDQNPSSTFETRNGPVSYAEYFRNHHGKEIHDLQQPMLIHRPTEKEKRESRGRPLEVICLVPELCFMTGLTDKARADFKLMKDLAIHTRISPAQRQQRLRQFTENVNSHPEARQVLASWGLSLAPDSQQITGRQMEPEMIYFRGTSSVSAGEKAEWSSAINRNTVREPVDLRTWLVVCTQRNAAEVGFFVSQLESAYKQLGVMINKPIFSAIANDRTETYLAEIRKNINNQLQLVMTVFPTSRDDRYNAVKKLCYCELPIASQVINSKTISRKDRVRSVAQKVALQMNCKLGGGLWSVKIPLEGLMIVGIDSYHDTPRGKNSWGGFVATLNRDCTNWYSRVCKQMPGQELINGLTVCMLSALQEYTKRNGAPPSRIVIFRDGVGEGDMKTVREHEVAQFAATFPKFGEGYKPRLTCIVVQKRINTKLYSQRGSGLDNPPPGTVVDHSVTRREMVDFYLVSQFVRQGTVTPTHYVIVHDESEWKVDHLQKLSYKMTHMYYNWPGTIRSPAPCQYAHKLAYMVGNSLHKDPDHRLCTRLFFL